MSVTTYLNFTTEEAINYVNNLIDGHRVSTNRHRALNYLKKTLKSDKDKHVSNSKVLHAVEQEIKRQTGLLSVGRTSVFVHSDTAASILSALSSGSHSGETFHVGGL